MAKASNKTNTGQAVDERVLRDGVDLTASTDQINKQIKAGNKAAGKGDGAKTVTVPQQELEVKD